MTDYSVVARFFRLNLLLLSLSLGQNDFYPPLARKTECQT
ncbi:Uncharacterised protein [Vibrio cholerae]|nr:Uncharacterised protein [Vibrio cholerae]